MRIFLEDENTPRVKKRKTEKVDEEEGRKFRAESGAQRATFPLELRV